MSLQQIRSIDDSQLDIYRNLKNTNLTRWSGRFIAEGKRVVERLLESDLTVESVLIREGLVDSLNCALFSDVETYVVPNDVARQLVGYNFHAGYLACGVRPEMIHVENLFKQTASNQLIMACPRITDPENLGTLIRLSRGFGVSGILLGHGCCDPFSRRVIRVSMGHAFYLPIRESAAFAEDVRSLIDSHAFEIVAAEVTETSRPLDQLVRPNRCVLMLGNEATGLDTECLNLADQTVMIPMAHGADSLNVALSGAIILYHLSQQACLTERSTESFEQ